jgi:hypothetical protein
MMFVGFLVVLWLLLTLRVVGGHPLLDNRSNFTLFACSLVIAIAPETLGLEAKRSGKKHRKRKRKYVNDIFNELGPYYVRRAYHMEPASFWKLCQLLRCHITKVSLTKKYRDGVKNGLIPLPTKVSVAIRYFAGGSPYDIALVHGISHTDVFRCVWTLVDAVNNCPELAFGYPSAWSGESRMAGLK